ncbi:MAG: hypothetical protein R3E79_51935 [Caldilineaceae bacterium]
MARADADHLHLQFPNHLFYAHVSVPFLPQKMGQSIIDSLSTQLAQPAYAFFVEKQRLPIGGTVA